MGLKGVVLAGGRSRRFGSDKALEKIGNVTFLEKACLALEKITQDVTIITNTETNYEFINHSIERDILPDKGPLGGLYTVFSLFPENDFLILTCDMPYLHEELLQQLLEESDVKCAVTLFDLKREPLQPFPGIYRNGLMPVVKKQIEQNQLSMQGFLGVISDKQLVQPHGSLGSFNNINSLRDLTI